MGVIRRSRPWGHFSESDAPAPSAALHQVRQGLSQTADAVPASRLRHHTLSCGPPPPHRRRTSHHRWTPSAVVPGGATMPTPEEFALAWARFCYVDQRLADDA